MGIRLTLISMMQFFFVTAFYGVPGTAPAHNGYSEVVMPFALQKNDWNENQERLYSLLRSERLEEAKRTVTDFEGKVKLGLISVEDVPVYYLYLVGKTFELAGLPLRAITYYERALSLLARNPVDSLAGKINYGLGRSYNIIGDDFKSDFYFSRSLKYEKTRKGIYSPELAIDYNALAIANINIHNYEKSLEYIRSGLEISERNQGKVDDKLLAMFHQTRGTALARMSDYYQAMISLERAQQIYLRKQAGDDPDFINMMDNLAAVSARLGDYDKAREVYETGISMFEGSNNFAFFHLVSNYAVFLAENGQTEQGDQLYSVILKKLQNNPSISARQYYRMLSEYAGYTRQYRGNAARSLQIYSDCFSYLKKNPWDLNLNSSVRLGYIHALLESNNPAAALDSANSLLFSHARLQGADDKYANPPAGKLEPGRRILDILQAKYLVLKNLARTGDNLSIQVGIAGTAELIIRILESVRLKIGEEQSRLILGDDFRDSYLNVIGATIDLYHKTGNRVYLDKAFEYTERSKAASLLASMRDVNAMKDYIPENLLLAEKKAKEAASYYALKREEELNKERPDVNLSEFWNLELDQAIAERDSLIRLFEKTYPEYYDLKYNTRVAGPPEVRKYLGADRNYLSYVLSDSVLYIMLLNSDTLYAHRVGVDSSFSGMIASFSRMHSDPERNNMAREEFELFQSYGYKLYTRLIEPVVDLLNSDILVISPDNLLSLFPFETLLTEDQKRGDLLYGRLAYLMKDFNISYTYSATLLLEQERTRPSIRNRSAVFAPSYKSRLHIDSLQQNRQQSNEYLSELRYAREEGEFVRRITSGALFAGEDALKHTFLVEAEDYTILHMAMHTFLNALTPVRSGMIFYETGNDDSTYLRPFEIYSLSLNAKMVVLSSCFTGTGDLHSGEGVLSLARGFIFAGSRSVVMSLWEVNDRSGLEIIKDFYRNLKAGKTKCEALRNARLDYLSSADMLRSHPYYWSTLVVYGDDSPLYTGRLTRTLLVLIPVMLIFYMASYLRKR